MNTTTKKTAYYQVYDPSVLGQSDYSIMQDTCDDIARLEDDIFEFGKDLIKLSKTLDKLDKQKIAAKIQAIVEEHCGDYLDADDSIANLDEYGDLEEYEGDEEDDEEYDGDGDGDGEEEDEEEVVEIYDANGNLVK